MTWTRPLMGEWDLADFITRREQPEAIAIDQGFCPDCGSDKFLCECDKIPTRYPGEAW